MKHLFSLRGTVIALVVAGALGGVGYIKSSRQAALADHGVVTIADIKDVRWMTRRGSARDYKFKIAFTAQEGRRIVETMDVDWRMGERGRNDASFVRLPVRYLPEDPSVVYPVDANVPGNTWKFLVALLALVGLLLPVIGQWKKSNDPGAVRGWRFTAPSRSGRP